MFGFLMADQNLIYSCALSIMLLLAVIEGVGLLIGVSLGHLLEQLLPIDIDTEIDIANPTNGMTALLGWLCIQQLPFMVWLVLLLTSFGVSGILLNLLTVNLFGNYLSLLISLPIALIFMMLLTRAMALPLTRLMPKNESSAVSQQSFIGRSARITTGAARRHLPAEAVLVDEFGQKHYVLVAPEDDSVLPAGTEVALLEKQQRYYVVRVIC